MSKKFTLDATLRKRSGTGLLKQLRREGFIPSVVYGGEEENKNIKVVTKTFTDMLAHSASANILVNLEVEGGAKQLAFIQAIQTDPLTGTIIHADFLAVDNKTEITAHIPLILIGEPVGRQRGGVLEQQIHDMEITCLPNDLPETIEADVTEMKIGDILFISAINLPEGVQTHLADDILVASVAVPRVIEEPTDEEEVDPDSVEATSQKDDEESEGEGDEKGEKTEKAEA